MTDERITAYLLEELTEQESEQFEEQCFTQDAWPVEFEAAEQDLIDAYLRNELTSTRRRRFEERYLTTDARKARVLVTRSMHEVLCPPPVKSTWTEWLHAIWQRPLVPQFSIAVLVLAVAAGIFLPRPGSPKTFTPIELAMSAPDRGPGGQQTIVSLPLNTDALQIRMKLPKPSSDIAGYRVQWENVNGPVHELKIESHDAQSIVVNIPAAEIKPGQYLLKLFNKNDLMGNYFFTAEPRTR